MHDTTHETARLADWRDVNAPDHSVEVYDDDVAMLDGLAQFMTGAISAGSPAIVIATPGHRAGLIDRIAALDDVAFADAQRHDRYIALDAEEVLSRFMVYGRFLTTVGSVVGRAAETVSPKDSYVAAFGEMVALLWADGKEQAALELEGLWNELAASYAFYLHCAYPLKLFVGAGDAEALNQICGHHSKVIGQTAGRAAFPGYTCPYCWAFSASLADWEKHCAMTHPQRSLRVARPLPYSGASQRARPPAE